MPRVARFLVVTAWLSTATAQPPDWKALGDELARLGERDQAKRRELEQRLADARAKGSTFNEAPLWKEILAADEANQKRFAEIVRAHGWPKRSQVGHAGANAAFGIVQHAGLDYQLVYLPMMRVAVATDEADPKALALLEDRVLMRQGKPQRYGSQVDTRRGVDLFPVEDPPGLDARRAAIGLQQICDYLQIFVAAHGEVVYPPCRKSRAAEKAAPSQE